MHIIKIFLVTLLFAARLCGLVTLEDHADGLQLTTLYGTTKITEPILIALIKCPAFERLKHINQYGVVHYVQGQFTFTRYQHSLGVFFLTRSFGAPLEEQIDALLHDVSHTVFSHVGDNVFNSDYRTGKQSYQDTIHEWHLQQNGIADILQTHGYDMKAVVADKKKHRCFDQDLPDICADRLEYNLSGGFLDKYISVQEIKNVLNSIHFSDGQWFFDDTEHAKKLAYISLQLSENRWGAAWGAFVDWSASQAIKRACELRLITTHDIHFSIDNTVWQILTSCNDAFIARQIMRIQNCHESFDICTPEASDMHVVGKFSGINPLVMIDGTLKRLTELDSDYKHEFDRVKKIVTSGWHIQYKNSAQSA